MLKTLLPDVGLHILVPVLLALCWNMLMPWLRSFRILLWMSWGLCETSLVGKAKLELHCDSSQDFKLSASKILHWFQKYTKDLTKMCFVWTETFFPTELLLLLSLDIYIPVEFNALVWIKYCKKVFFLPKKKEHFFFASCCKEMQQEEQKGIQLCSQGVISLGMVNVILSFHTAELHLSQCALLTTLHAYIAALRLCLSTALLGEKR